MVNCCSINMRIFKATELILLLFSIVVSPMTAAPATSLQPLERSMESSGSSQPTQIGDHFDQRQNGTENYRIHLDGLVVVVAPAEALLLAGGMPGISGTDILSIGQPGSDAVNLSPPPKPEEENTMKPIDKSGSEPFAHKTDGKSSHRPGLRLMSILSPLLRRVQSHQ